MAQRLWSNDQATEWGVEVFTEGECWTLAYYVHRMGNWPVYWLEREPYYWEHVVVKVGYNKYLDVNGVQTRLQLLEAWPGLHLRYIGQYSSWLAYIKILCGEHIYLNAHQRSRSMAKRLVKRYVQTA